jgi:gluconokinase
MFAWFRNYALNPKSCYLNHMEYTPPKQDTTDRSAAAVVTIIMGVTGCGKSTFGRARADQIGALFIEGDDLHPSENIAKMRSGTALCDDDRWPWLDRIAAAVNQNAASGRDIVTTCSALKKSYRNYLRAAICNPLQFIFLDIPAAELTKRVTQRKGHFMPPELLASQISTLERPDSEADVLILTT